MQQSPQTSSKAASQNQDLGILTVITALNITLYLASNLMSVRLIHLGFLGTCDAGTLLFPAVFMLGDVLTEIWGLRITRKIIWLTFACNVLMVGATSLVTILPAPACQTAMAVDAYRTVFLNVPRLIIASLTAFLAGEFTNAWLMAKIKEWTGEPHLWLRTIGSSIPGYLLDSFVFSFIAFGGTAPVQAMLNIVLLQFAAKMFMEVIISTPLAYGAIALLKKTLIPQQSTDKKP